MSRTHPPRSSSSPAKYVIVREHLLSLIDNGLAAGCPVPSERELTEQFAVSRMTVRQAIDTLVVDGILERHQGRGTFVAPPKVDMQARLTSYTEEMRRRGMEPGSVILVAETVAAPRAVSEALEIEPKELVHHFRRLLTADAVPMAIVENWLPAAQVAKLPDTSRGFSVYAELARQNLSPQWGEDLIEAHAATAEEATLLSVPAKAPTLDITRRSFHGETVVDYSRSLYRADRYTLWVPVSTPATMTRPRALTKGAST